jgi:hypothetical protein
MAGEDSQGDRQVLAASDLWSCGIVIYVRGRAEWFLNVSESGFKLQK